MSDPETSNIDEISERRVAHGLAPLPGSKLALEAEAKARTEAEAKAAAEAAISKNTTSTLATSSSIRASASGALPDALSGSLSGQLSGQLSGSPSATGEVAHAKRDPEETRASAKKRHEEAQRKQRRRRIRNTIILSIIVVIIAIVAVFCCTRWVFADDHAAFQGKWRIQGSDVSISIDDEHITLNDEVSYAYAIDPAAKTISYAFGGLSGDGRYRISLDGKQLAILDGKHNIMSTLMSDIPWTLEAISSAFFGQALSPAVGEKGIVLERIPDPADSVGVSSTADGEDAASPDDGTASPDDGTAFPDDGEGEGADDSSVDSDDADVEPDAEG